MDPRTNEPTARQRITESAQQGADYARSHSTNEMADDARAKANEVASDARAKASEIADNVRDKASEAGSQATEKINSALSNTGQQMSSLAQTVRERAPSGQLGDVANATAGALERSGRYLQDQDLQGVRSDLETLIRRRPIESLLVGLGIGFLFARSMRR